MDLHAKVKTMLTLVVGIFCTSLMSCIQDSDFNIVAQIVNAPVVANGIIAGEPSEINIFLRANARTEDLTFDPSIFGHRIPRGGRMEIYLGGTFERNGVDNLQPLVAIDSNALVVLSTGHPQNPIVAAAGAGVQHGNYTITDDGARTIIITPNAGLFDDGLENDRAQKIGVKAIHIRPDAATGVVPFTNGPASTSGFVKVTIYNDRNLTISSGVGMVRFQSSIGRQVAVTNAGLITPDQGNPTTTGAELIESTNFQHVAANTAMTNTGLTGVFSVGAPYAPRFLLFEEHALQPDSFIPMQGIANVGYLVDTQSASRATLYQDANADGLLDATDTAIGSVHMVGPTQTSSGKILPSTALTTSGDGLIGDNGSLLNIPVQVGSARGEYHLTVLLDNGGSARTRIFVD